MNAVRFYGSVQQSIGIHAAASIKEGTTPLEIHLVCSATKMDFRFDYGHARDAEYSVHQI